MPIAMYQASVPVFVRGLSIFAIVLNRGETHARETGQDPATLTAARLAPDMLPLTGQVQRASDTSKLALERLTGIVAPRMEDNEQSFADLQTRIDRTMTYLKNFTEVQLEGSETRRVTVKTEKFETSFSGDAYLLTFALPNFFFHITTAYDILRHKGVPLGKRDYLGNFEG
jgi:hypothetical protein